MFASGLVWLAAGVVALSSTPARAVGALFVGGMCIHPLGIGLAKLLGRRGAHTKGNPLGALALESTALLLLGFALAYVAAQAKLSWFFPSMLLVIGGRYLTFATLYGLRVYWACGGALAATGFVLAMTNAAVAAGAFAGAAIEMLFAVWILVAVQRAERR